MQSGLSSEEEDLVAGGGTEPAGNCLYLLACILVFHVLFRRSYDAPFSLLTELKASIAVCLRQETSTSSNLFDSIAQTIFESCSIFCGV